MLINKSLEKSMSSSAYVKNPVIAKQGKEREGKNFK
jgi:hypothetical protein